MEGVVLTEAARAGARRHEKGACRRVEVRRERLPQHVARRDDCWKALLPDGVPPAELETLLVRGGHDARVYPRGPERGGEAVGVLAHVGDEEYAAVNAPLDKKGGRRKRARRGAVDVLQTLQEGFAAGHDAGVGAVLVDLDLQEGLPAHSLSEKGREEGVGAAPEVGEVDGVKAFAAAHDGRRFQYPLAVLPEHVIPVVVVAVPVHLQEIHRDGHHPHAAKLPGQVEVYPRIAPVVPPAYDYARLRSWRQSGDDLRAPLPQPHVEILLGGPRPLRGIGHVLPGNAVGLQALEEGPDQILPGPVQVDDRPYERAPGKLAPEGDAQKVGNCLDVGAEEIALLAVVVLGARDDAGDEDVLDPLLYQIDGVTVGGLDREAGLGEHRLDPPPDDRLVRPLGEDYPETEVGEEA